MEQPLKGLTVLDFGQVYNGPYCGFLLAQAGARVIKIESLSGETLRARGKLSASSYPFANLNANKEGMALNIKTDQGQALVRALASKADVIVQNFAPGTMEKYGLGAADLRAENPRLIYAMGTGYGATEGPYKDYLGMDITLQAMSGVMGMTGEPDGPPTKSPAASIDFLAGTHLYAGIVTALLARATSGEGATVDISMQDCVFPTMSTVIGSYYTVGHDLPRAGSRHPAGAIAPYNVYEAADGHVALICLGEGHWRKMCDAMDEPELVNDPRFSSMAQRSIHIDAVDERVNQWTRDKTRADITRITQAHGVICAPVQRVSEILQDPHMLARGSLVSQTHPETGSMTQFQTPLRFHGLTPPTLGAEPALGADTRKVLQELLGLGEAELDQLVLDQAIG